MIITPNLKRGGAERVLSVLGQEWSKKHEVIFVLFDANEIAYDYGGKILNLNIPANRFFIFKVFF